MRYKQFLLLLTALIVSWVAQAQSLDDYRFDTGVDTTRWITLDSNATVIWNTYRDAAVSSVYNLGFTFPLVEEAYSQFSVSSNGIFRLGPDAADRDGAAGQFTASSYNLSLPKICGVTRYMGTGSNGYVKYELTGSAPNRVFVCEFCLSPFSGSGRTADVMWQVQLHEDSSRVVIVYGSNTPVTIPSSFQTGLATDFDDIIVIDPTTHTAIHSTVPYSTTYYTWHGAGRYYSFTRMPIPCAKPVSASVENLEPTSATISWDDTTHVASWTVRLDTNGAIYTLVDVFDTSVTFTGLIPDREYVFHVANVCDADNISAWRRIGFRTPCTYLDRFPYFEDFERYGYSVLDIACWHTGITTLEGSPITSNVITARADVGDDTVGLSLFGSLSPSSRYYCWAAMPRVDDSVDVADLEVSFLIKRPNTAEYLSQLVVGVASDPAIPGDYHFDSTFVPIDTIDVSNEPITSLHAFSVTFENYTGNGKYIVFQALAPPVSAPTYTSNSLLLDNVMLRTAAGCPTPQHVRVTRTTADSVFVTWNPVAGADTMWVYVGTPGFHIEDVTPHMAIGNTCVIGNLSPDTEYELVVAASCGGSVGYGSYPASFRTLCAPITTLPFVESFEDVAGYTFPPAYPAANVNNLPSCWRYYYRGNNWGTLGYPIVYSDPSYAHSGNNSMSLISSSRVQIAVMPLTDSTLFPVSGLHVSFWMRSYDQYTPIVVGVMSNPADTNTFVPVDTCQITGLYSHYGVGFASYTGPHGHIAFRPLPPNVGSRNPYLYIDDITIAERPPCVPITAMHVETTASAARMTWRYDYHFGTPTGYIVSYRPADDTTVTPTVLTTTAPEMILTGLGTDSTYWLSIVPVCGDDSGAAYTTTFSTQALPCVDWDTTNLAGDTLTLGNPGTGTNTFFPVNATAPFFTQAQHLFLASEIPVSGATTLQGIGFDYADNPPGLYYPNCTIYLSHTTSDSMTNSFLGVGQMVFTGSIAFGASGWNYVSFNQGLFEYDGESNLCVTIVKNYDLPDNLNHTFRHETTATQMARWGYRPRPTGAYTMSFAGTNMRSNTRLITSGDVYCGLWDTCFPPIVYIDTIAEGDYYLKWIPGYQETGWSVDYRMVDSTNWNYVDGITSTELPLSSLYLEPSSTYEFRVTPNCGDTSYATSVLFTTPCTHLTIPFDYDFDRLPMGTYSEPPVIPCWHHLNNSLVQNGLPYISYRAHSGNRGLAFGVGTTAQAPDYQVIVLPRVDVATDPINTLNMSFWAKTEGVYYSPVFYVGVMTDPTDIATFQYVDTIEVNHSNTNWDLYPVDLEDYDGYGEYIAIRANRPDTGIGWGAYIDDIHLDNVPLCRRVRNVNVHHITTNSATLSWTRGGRETSWELIVGDSVYYATDTFYTVSTLDSNTFYDVTVRAICGEGDTSISSATYFQTPCYFLNSLPYFNDFENEPYHEPRVTSYYDAFPACWRRFNSTPSNANANHYPYIVNSSTGSIHGHNVMYWELYYDNDYDRHQHAILPPVDTNIFNMSDLTMSFFAKVRSRSDTNTRFVVGVMENSTDSSTFVPVDTVRLTIMDTMYVVSFSNYTGTGSYIALRSLLPRNSSDALLDDVFLTDHWCNPPTRVHASSTDTSVTVMWSSNDSSFTVVLGTDTVRGVTDTFYTFNRLADSTNYTYYVATECSQSHSMYVVDSIQTECPPLTYADLPYYEDFERYGYGRDSAISRCWHRGMTALIGITSSYDYPYPSQCLIGDDTVGLIFTGRRNTSIKYSTWAALPKLDNPVDVTQLELTFLVKRPDASVRPVPHSCLVVGVASDISTDSTFVPVDTIDLSDEPINSLHHIAVSFDNYVGSGKYIVIQAPPPPDTAMSESNGFTLDNVMLRMSAGCPTPQRIRVTRTTFDSVYATWNAIANADTWLVYIGEPGSHIEDAIPHYVYSNSCAIGGLDPNTDYELVVVASCGGSEGYSSYPVPFHTLCAPLTSLPFVEDFEGPTGYTYPVASVNNLPDCWQYYNPTIESSYRGYPIIYNDPTLAHRGRQSMSLRTNNIAIMPLTDATLFPVSSLKVSLWILSEMQYAHVVAGVMSDPTDTNTFVAVDTVPVVWVGGVGYPYSHHTVKFLDYTGPHGYIAFKAPQLDWGSNQPYIDDITLEEMCPHVEGLQVSNTAVGSFTIDWHSTGSRYEVDIRPDTAPWPATPISVIDTTYTFTGLQPATLYHYRVRQDCSADTLGHSYWTEGSFDTRYWPCLTPDSPTVSNITNTSATFDWDPVGYESMWELHVWFSGGLDSVYAVSSHPVTVRGFSSNTTYRASVRSLCDTTLHNVGVWGDTLVFTTHVCPDVTGLTVGDVTAHSLILSWNADTFAHEWQVEYGLTGFEQGSGTQVVTTTPSCVVTGLYAGTSYDIYVRATCGTGWYSENWTYVAVSTADREDQCGPVTDLAVTEVTENSAVVSWTHSPTSYECEVVLANLSGATLSEARTHEQRYQLNGLTPGTTYEVKVRTVCGEDWYSDYVGARFTTTAVHIDGVGEANCTIYPNPTSSATTISVSGVSGKVRIAVVDIKGRTVASELLECSSDCTKTMDVERLAQGAYFVRITGENVSMVRKLIVR